MNQKLDEAIEALGGMIPAAYHLKTTPQTLYRWKKAGRVFDAADAVLFARLAREMGWHGTIEDLALPPKGETVGPQPGNGRRRHNARLGTGEARHLAAVETVDQGEVPPASEMQIPLGRLDARVSREVSQTPRIRPALCEVSEEGVAEGMRRGVRNAGFDARFPHHIANRAA